MFLCVLSSLFKVTIWGHDLKMLEPRFYGCNRWNCTYNMERAQVTAGGELNQRKSFLHERKLITGQ